MSTRRKWLVFLALAILFLSIDGQLSGGEISPAIVIKKTKTSPVIDGKLDEECWKDAARIEGFTLFESQAKARLRAVAGVEIGKEEIEKIPMKEKTICRVTYDNECLYLGFHCEDPQVSKTLSVLARPFFNFFEEDMEISIASHDDKTWFQFVLNAAGEKRQFLTTPTKTNPLDSKWNSRTTHGQGYWQVEAAIPFESLDTTTPFPGTRWRVLFARAHINLAGEYVPWSSGEFGSWPALSGEKGFLDPEHFGNLYFEKEPPCSVELIGFLSPPVLGLNQAKLKIKHTELTQEELLVQTKVFSSGKYFPAINHPVSLSKGKEQEVITSYEVGEIKGERAELVVSLFSKDGKISYLETKHPLPLPASLFEMSMESDIYSLEKSLPIAFKVNIQRELLPNYFLNITVKKENKICAREKIEQLDQDLSYDLKVKDLSLGRYIIRTELVDKKGTLLAHRELSFQKSKGPFDDLKKEE